MSLSVSRFPAQINLVLLNLIYIVTKKKKNLIYTDIHIPNSFGLSFLAKVIDVKYFHPKEKMVIHFLLGLVQLTWFHINLL